MQQTNWIISYTTNPDARTQTSGLLVGQGDITQTAVKQPDGSLLYPFLGQPVPVTLAQVDAGKSLEFPFTGFQLQVLRIDTLNLAGAVKGSKCISCDLGLPPADGKLVFSVYKDV